MVTSSATAPQRVPVGSSQWGPTPPPIPWPAWSQGSSTLSPSGQSKERNPARRFPHKLKQVSNQARLANLKRIPDLKRHHPKSSFFITKFWRLSLDMHCINQTAHMLNHSTQIWPVYWRNSSLSIHAAIYPSTCQHSIQSTEIKAAWASISYWLARGTVPPAGPRSPCSLSLSGHMRNRGWHSGLIAPSDQNSSAASTLAVQLLCFLSEVSPVLCWLRSNCQTFFSIPTDKLTFHEPTTSALHIRMLSLCIWPVYPVTPTVKSIWFFEK